MGSLGVSEFLGRVVNLDKCYSVCRVLHCLAMHGCVAWWDARCALCTESFGEKKRHKHWGLGKLLQPLMWVPWVSYSNGSGPS